MVDESPVHRKVLQLAAELFPRATIANRKQVEPVELPRLFASELLRWKSRFQNLLANCFWELNRSQA